MIHKAWTDRGLDDEKNWQEQKFTLVLIEKRLH